MSLINLTRKNRIVLTFLLGALSISIFYQNCGVTKPSVENKEFASVGYKHTGNETTCSACHEVARPISSNGFIGLNPSAPFNYATHGSGFDCISCHGNTTKVSRTKADWAGAIFNHPATLSSCVNCHSTERPTSIVSGFDHKTSGTGDCFGCHQTSLSSSFSSMSDWSGGVGTPTSLVWDSAQDITYTEYLATYSGTTMVSPLTTKNQTVHMGMSHITTQLSSATLQNCSICHAGATQGVYYPGIMHASLAVSGLAQPKNCSECHSGAMPTGFIGPVDTTRSPQSPAMKHDAVVWTKSNGVTSPTATNIVVNDCSACHTAPGATSVGWTGGVYHASLTTAGMAQPSSCVDCHANKRPTGLAPATPVAGVTSFDHVAGGAGDCVSCHTGSTTWSTGKYHASAGTQASCTSCHGNERPTTNTTYFGTAFLGYDSTNKPFDLATHGGTMDCVTCHASPSANPVIGNWSGGNFVHSASLTSCVSCHSSQRPSTIVSGMDHSLNGKGDCVGCHQQSITNNVFTSMANWAGGQTVPTGLAGSTKLASLNTLVLNYTGAAVTSVTATTQANLPLQFLHSSAQIPAALRAPTTTSCVTCHASYPTNYSGGKFHSSITAAQNTAITSCNDCHLGTRPTNIVGAGAIVGNTALKPMDHAAALSGASNVSSLDCFTCHKTPGGAGNFASATFHNNLSGKTPTNCTTCHYVIEPTSATPVNKMVHVSTANTKDCGSCHAMPTAGQITAPAATNWSGGTFHANLSTQPTANCNECHLSQRPTTNKVSTADASGQIMRHTANDAIAFDCAKCHSGDVNLATRVWSTADQFHPVVTATACTDCHGLGNGSTVAGTGNNLPAGLTNSHTKTTSTFVTANTLDQLTHTATDVAGKDCDTCHTQKGITLTSGNTITPPWNNAKFHKNVPVLTGNCNSCHNNLINTAAGKVLNGMDHNTIGTNDCKTCHSYNATAPTWSGATGGMPAKVTLAAVNVTSGGKTYTVAPAVQIDHPTVKTGMSCTTCHSGTPTMGQLIGYDHNDKLNAGQKLSCYYCHDTNQVVINKTAAATNTAWTSPKSITLKTIANPSKHTATSYTAQGTCVGCHHNNNGPTWNTTTNKFSGGSNF